MSDTRRLRDSRQLVHYLRLEKFGLQAKVERLEQELAEAKNETDKYRQWHEHVGKSMKYYRDDMLPAAQQQVTALWEALEACLHEFRMMNDPYLPSDRHLTPVADMVGMLEAALAATPPAVEEPETDLMLGTIDCTCPANENEPKDDKCPIHLFDPPPAAGEPETACPCDVEPCHSCQEITSYTRGKIYHSPDCSMCAGKIQVTEGAS